MHLCKDVTSYYYKALLFINAMLLTLLVTRILIIVQFTNKKPFALFVQGFLWLSFASRTVVPSWGLWFDFSFFFYFPNISGWPQIKRSLLQFSWLLFLVFNLYHIWYLFFSNSSILLLQTFFFLASFPMQNLLAASVVAN